MSNEQKVYAEFTKRFGKTYIIHNMRLSCQTEGHRYNDQSICVVCGCGMRDVTPPDRDAT